MTESATTLAPTASNRRASPRVAVLRAEARLYGREPSNLLAAAFPPVLLVILGAVPAFREHDPALGGLRVIDLYVPVMVLVALITAGLQLFPPTLTSYREMGVLRRMSTTPVRPSSLLSAQMALNGLAGLVSALISIVVGRLVYDVALPTEVGGYAVALLLAAIACLAMGAVVAAQAKTAKHATGIGLAVFFPALFCAGLWIPVRSMPDVLANIVEYTPFGAATLALSDAAEGSWPSWFHLSVLAIWAAVATVIAVRWFRWE